MRGLSIGTKMVIMLGGVAIAISGVGLFFLYGQEHENMLHKLEAEGKVIQAHMEVTRAYIAKNYVGKMKNSSLASGMVVARDHAANPNAIPFPATAAPETLSALARRNIGPLLDSSTLEKESRPPITTWRAVCSKESLGPLAGLNDDSLTNRD